MEKQTIPQTGAQATSTPIYQALRDAILMGEYMPGDRLSENKIAEQFGTSRTPVRDAFRMLANDGMLSIFPNRFVELTTYDDAEVMQLGIVRLQLDLLSVRLAIHYGSNADYGNLERIAQACKDAAQLQDRLRALELDRDFHLELAKISGNRFLLEMQDRIWSRTLYVLATNAFEIHDYAERVDSHRDIIQALYARDEAKALQEIKEHLSLAYHYDERFPNGIIDQL